MIKYVLCWLMLWQDSMVGDNLMQLSQYGLSIPYMATAEVMAVMIALVVLMERSLTHDFTIRRSYFSGPMLLILGLFFFSWIRGCYINQKFAPVLEAHEAFAWPFALFVINNAFRDKEDCEVLWKLLVLAVIPKSIEGLEVYLFSSAPNKNWGVVQLWRDGYLLGIGAIATMLLAQYHGQRLRVLKYAMLLSLPFLGFTFIMSYRRTFMVSAVACAFAMFLTLPRGREPFHGTNMRRRHAAIFLGFLATLGLFVATINPVGVLARLAGIVEPGAEGSAYIRLMELPNVIENIERNPIMGVPVGTQWKAYYRMPISAVYTTLGTHDAYLYWPLRAGIFGAFAFGWLLGRMWKMAIVNNALRKTEEDLFYGQLGMQLLLLYQVACFFGLMYADDLPTMMAVLMTALQLQAQRLTGRRSYKEVALWATFRSKAPVFKPSALEKARGHSGPAVPVLGGAS